ncbi:gamma-glutamylcyclotransferase [Rheinheimera aquimaris]|uniref:gamma-glutamylcyclotransferase family protein n=1 Tax=Rheinheimera aquimaris TaxID=412437 RepID=UPI001E5694D2|nr:gamma-glutamylcyclotransferase family protein [Rheinheimera aquimaris]MCD1598986.1 gamma-glutamylcyclotransferase [Rheinheimera aquimaris]
MADFLFVYGTLRRACAHPMHTVLAADSRYVGIAHYQGKLYRVSHYPGVVPSGNPAQQVVGEVYQLFKPLQTLAELDRYEECSADFPAPHEYRRELQQVTLENGCGVNAWVYVYNHSTDKLTPILSGDFLALPNTQ